jgi:hypothetical protein
VAERVDFVRWYERWRAGRSMAAAHAVELLWCEQVL